MIITPNTKVIIDKCVEKHVPDGIHKHFHMNCQEHVSRTIEKMIEKNLLSDDADDINLVVELTWEELVVRYLSLVN
jgi:hypothetical protein